MQHFLMNKIATVFASLILKHGLTHYFSSWIGVFLNKHHSLLSNVLKTIDEQSLWNKGLAAMETYLSS